jgi:phosphatidylglycerophosphate synthase
VNDKGNTGLKVEDENISFMKRSLADFLTLSRGVIGLVILALSVIGKEAYLAIVILALIGGATDILDGKFARHYLGEDREGKLGKYDIEIDTLFILCIIGYLSFSKIVIPRILGFGWVGLVLALVVLYKRNPKILVMFEILSVIVLLTVAGLYNLGIFVFIIVPVMAAGIIVNRKRVLYLIFDYWPKLFFGKC